MKNINLRIALIELGVRQMDLARRVGTSEFTISRIVNGLQTPTPELRAKIADALKVSERWLFFQGPAVIVPRSIPARKVNAGACEV